MEEQIQAKKADIKMTEQRIEKEKANLEQAKQSEMNKKMEEAGLQDKVKAFEMIENIKVKKRVLKEKGKTIQEDLAQLQEVFKNTEDVGELEKEALRVKNYLDEIKQDRKSAEINIGGLQKQIQFIEKEIKVLSEERANIQMQIQNNINDSNKVKAILKKREQVKLALNRNMESVCAEEKTMEGKKQSVETKVNHLNQSAFVLQHKIEEMKKLISRFETVNEGADDLRQWRPEEFQSLFQKLKVETDYATVLGVVLGHHIQALVPQEDSSIEQAVQRLKSRSKGKTSFLSSLPASPAPQSLKQKIKTYPAFICFLDEKIQWSFFVESLRPCLEQTVVVSDLHSAFELKKQFPSFQFVTKREI